MNIYFSDKEKDLVKKIVKYDWSKFSTIDRFLADECGLEMLVLLSMDNYVLYYNCSVPDVERNQALSDFLELIHALKKLIINNLIIVTPGINCDRYIGNKEIDQQKSNVNTIQFTDGSYVSKIDAKWYDSSAQIIKGCISFPTDKFDFGEFFCGVPLISPELKELVLNNFETNEQKVLFWTRIAAIVAIIGLLLAILLPIFSKTKINSSQMNEIEQVIRESNRQQSSTIVVNGTSDGNGGSQITYEINN